MSNTDPRDLFISANPNGLSSAELAKDTSGFVDERTHADYLVFKAGFDAAQPSEQTQGEPVAYLRASDLERLAPKHVQGCAASLAKDPCEGFVGIYTHADPGEVERLRSDLDECDGDRWKLRTERNTLRAQLAELESKYRQELADNVTRTARLADRYSAQLAERDALLRRALGAIAEVGRQDHLIDYTMVSVVKREIDAALSVSAEPSAPVERDERAEFEKWYLAEYYEGDAQCGLEWLSTEPCGGYRYSEPARHWKAWQARAALARKA